MSNANKQGGKGGGLPPNQPKPVIPKPPIPPGRWERVAPAPPPSKRPL